MGAGPRRGQTSGDVGIGDRPLPAGHCRKTANALFALELARRATAVGITANAVHPGGVMTGLQQHLSREDMNALGWLHADGKPRQGFKTPAQGCRHLRLVRHGGRAGGQGGLYLEDCREGEPVRPDVPFAGYHAHVRDPEAARRLWAVSEEMLGESVAF